MSRPRCYFLVNGIRTRTGDHAAWTRRAERWIELNTPHGAYAYDYHTPALLRQLAQGRHARQVGGFLAEHCAHAVTAVGHSNGCELLCRALRETPGLRLDALHLFAAAAHADCDANGLNAAAAEGRVRRIHLYGSRNDLALWAGRLTRFLRPLGMGYGDLGRAGPANLRGPARAVTGLTWRDDFGHSTWFEPAHFAATMRRVTA